MLAETTNTITSTALIQCMSSDAFWGIVGTLLGTIIGTILGWLLNEISNRGNLNVFLRTWEESFMAQDKMGGFIEQHKIANTETYGYKATIEIYNSSKNPMIMRDIRIVYKSKKSTLLQSVPEDDSTGRQNGPMRFFDEIGAYNIPGNEVITIKLHGGYWKKDNNLLFLKSTDEIWFEYKDSKNKIRRSLLKRTNYTSYFTNTPEE